MPKDPLQLKAELLQDQSHAYIRDHSSDVQRIAMEGPQVDDAIFIQSVFAVIAGDLCMERVKNCDVQ